MTEEPTQSPAEAFRAEQERLGTTATPEVREWTRQQLAAARKAGPERFEALRARSKRGAAEMFGRQHTDSPAA